MKEKIKKWEDEIAQLIEKQKEMNEKYNSGIRDRRKKIQEAQETLRLENDRIIGDVVREIYGEVDKDTIVSFRALMLQMKGNRKQEEGSGAAPGSSGGVKV